ncbi:50S ribosomal protein L3, partial [Candidatus Woesebacteria bacterium RIFOXYD1_FULL_46_19]
AVGDTIAASDIFSVGDIIQVTGTSKGKGFAGVVKRWGFAGGPRTHGQSDRERAPGSIGQTTTPGRVFKGKKMAGRMGGERVTLKNLQIVSVNPETNEIEISGPVPGIPGGLLVIKRLSEGKLEGIQEVQAQVVEGEAPAGEGAEEVKAETPTEVAPEGGQNEQG